MILHMKILFITNDLIGGDVARLLVKEGHDVKLFIEEKKRRHNFDNIVQKTNNWRKELKWVGKDGLIIFDDVGYGKIQDTLRNKGYSVFGGSELGDKLEMDREYGQSIFARYGLKTVPLKDFENLDDAVMYAKANPKAWVIKRNAGPTKFVSYVSQFDDGRDAIGLMRNYHHNKVTSDLKISLHQKVEGVEMGIGRFFNGEDWVGPIEYNIEHTLFMPGDIGPTTSEMGTLAWYGTDETNKLFKETLAPLKGYLKEIGFKGDMGINCIVNETGAYILEATSRLGSPIVHLQSDIHSSPWGEFMYAIAKGQQYDLKWKKGYGIVVLLAIPPFPYSKESKDANFYGINIYFKDITSEEKKFVHYEEVSKRTMEEVEQLYISDNRGYVFYVNGIGTTVSDAQKKAYSIVNKIVIPKMIYRNDIGTRFINESAEKLKKWGYLTQSW